MGLGCYMPTLTLAHMYTHLHAYTHGVRTMSNGDKATWSKSQQQGPGGNRTHNPRIENPGP